nr:F-box/WD repeat-containing protein 4-like [Lytechinus pictus]
MDGEQLAPQKVIMPNFLDFPVELIIAVLDYLPVRDLNRMCETCRRMREVCSRLLIWRRLGKSYVHFENSSGRELITNMKSLSLREQCRIAHNWSTGFHTEHIYIRFKTGLLPWLQLTTDHLYISNMNKISRYKVQSGGRLRSLQSSKKEIKYTGHSQDVNKFVVKENNVVGGGSDGRAIVWDKASGRTIQALQSNLGSLVSIDATREIIVAGTNGGGVQMWSQSDGRGVCNVPMKDRVWSLIVDPTQRLFATGTSGITDYTSLKVWDIATSENTPMLVCGENKRQGEGILDLIFESSNVLLSAGYDTFVRQWDIRTPRLPVMEFEEPSDNAVYCISSDNNYFIAAGYCRHGIVRFWDKRRSDICFQTIYVGGNVKSPVYSLQFNKHCLYAALSHAVYVLDFGAYKPEHENYTSPLEPLTLLSQY